MTVPSLPSLDVRSLLSQYGIRPRKGLGQNFLQDDRDLRSIADAALIQRTDRVLEIGAGLGNLTRYLALSAAHVTAVELDRELIPILTSTLAPYKNIDLVHGDILKLDPADLMKNQGYLVVANIPYYITSNVVRHLLESSDPPRRLVLTMQAEVAERICAAPGKMSLLALSVQVYGSPDIVFRIPAKSFYPSPKVDSAVLRVEIYPQPLIPFSLLNIYFRVIKAGFSQRRKTLRNSLGAGLAIPPSDIEKKLLAAGIDPMRRAETLAIAEWAKLCEQIRIR